MEIQTVDLWCRKQPLYQLSHQHCPSFNCLIIILIWNQIGPIRVTSKVPSVVPSVVTSIILLWYHSSTHLVASLVASKSTVLSYQQTVEQQLFFKRVSFGFSSFCFHFSFPELQTCSDVLTPRRDNSRDRQKKERLKLKQLFKLGHERVANL